MSDASLQRITSRLYKTLRKDAVVQSTTDNLRETLQVDRVVLYYFYRQWYGQVTFESLLDQKLSIIGETGPDECFNGDYAAMFLGGRVGAVPDIETEPIHECHRDYLRQLKVRANLVVPVLNYQGLWGLLIAHHCTDRREWLPADIELMKEAAKTLANAGAIRDNLPV